jgi:rhodanese domain-containing protein
MKKIAGIILTGVLLTVVGCSNNASMQETTVKETAASSVATSEKAGESVNTSEAQKQAGSYTHIDQETAKKMMESEDGHIIVDVRSKDEYASGHIPGAICIPNENITNTQPEELPDLDQVILVYCRSGNRSRQASEKLAAMGYINVYEFGGIKDWTGETVAGN